MVGGRTGAWGALVALALGACSGLDPLPGDDGPDADDGADTDDGGPVDDTDVDEPVDTDPADDTDRPGPADTASPDDTAATDDTGPDDSDPPGDDTAADDTGAGPLPWSSSITVDGDLSEWSAEETFLTTSAGTERTHITWDATHLYVAASHPDVGASAQHWFVVVLGSGSGGSTTGAVLNTQEPSLPSPAHSILRWKADDSYDDWLMWDGTGWDPTPGWLGTQGSAKAWSSTDDTIELAIPFTAFAGAPTFTVATRWVFEGAGFESTYAGTPDDSFTDGYDPDLATVLTFDRTAPDAPITSAP